MARLKPVDPGPDPEDLDVDRRLKLMRRHTEGKDTKKPWPALVDLFDGDRTAAAEWLRSERDRLRESGWRIA